jgi:hypothetical protein
MGLKRRRRMPARRMVVANIPAEQRYFSIAPIAHKEKIFPLS